MVDRYVMLETDVDDCSSEVISFLTERVMDEGALDVQVISAAMKKGRLGFLIRLFIRGADAEKFSRILMEETGTLGVRVMPVLRRYEAERGIVVKEIRIQGEVEEVRVKKSGHTMKPEFDDVRRICLKYNLSFREVLKKIRESLVDD